ncbi:MAG TPA: hypothetical protein VE662_07135, partial [Solirubrobacterales bacterium]|nr:hypothetical protein [Solirubrobacterales bacterium]
EVEGEAEKKPETAAAREAGTGDVRSVGESTRARLAQSLGLTKAQEAKLDTILEETRRQRRALGDGMSEDERQEQAKSIRQARRERIREILTPDQRARFDQGVGRDAVRDEASGVSGRVWVLGRGGQPTPVAVRLGVTDGKVTEVLEGDLSEGQEVIVGRAVPEAVPGPPASAPGAAPRIRL